MQPRAAEVLEQLPAALEDTAGYSSQAAVLVGASSAPIAGTCPNNWELSGEVEAVV